MNKKQQSQFRTCPCCNPAIDLLAQTFLSRRKFMLLGTGALAATVILSDRSQAIPKSDVPLEKGNKAIADKIYLNANVVTVNDAQPKAEAVAVKDGKILGVGDRAAIERLKGKSTQIIDLQGKTMVPGFIDPHGHLFQQGVAAVVADLLPPPPRWRCR
jgi:Amidohydrolase family